MATGVLQLCTTQAWFVGERRQALAGPPGLSAMAVGTRGAWEMEKVGGQRIAVPLIRYAFEEGQSGGDIPSQLSGRCLACYDARKLTSKHLSSLGQDI